MMNDPVIRGPVFRPAATTAGAGAQKRSTVAFGSLIAQESAAEIEDSRPAVETGAANPLLLHEIACDAAARRDREARRHASDLLGALAALQHALVGLGRDGDPRAALEALVAGAPPPSDPVLAALQGAILLRARVELARLASPTRTASRD